MGQRQDNQAWEGIIMIKLIKSKLNNRSGETLAETLIAVLISALALVLLLSMITASSRLIQNGEAKMQEMYDGSKKIEQAEITPTVATVKINDNALDGLGKISVNVKLYKDADSSLSKYEYNPAS